VRTTARNLANSEVSYVRAKVGEKSETFLSVAEIRMMLALNRCKNLICECCGSKDNPDALMPCKTCFTVHYCSDDCVQRHWHAQHKEHCMNPFAPREDGYSATVII
jgi:hypothetical protein